MKTLVVLVLGIVIMAALYVVGFFINKYLAFPFAEISVTDAQLHMFMVFNIAFTLVMKAIAIIIDWISGK